MPQYLVESDGTVMLMVQGPIKLQPGQKLVDCSQTIPVSLAKYDPKTNSILKKPNSALAIAHSQAKEAAKEQHLQAKKELMEATADLDPKMKRVLRLMLTLPRELVLEYLEK